ncbi:MAG: hypothetical protein IPF90_01970 [Actinomycetales bacterium]|nr:hypothetical protein [Candidatus Phosphoribacter baldrii]
MCQIPDTPPPGMPPEESAHGIRECVSGGHEVTPSVCAAPAHHPDRRVLVGADWGPGVTKAPLLVADGCGGDGDALRTGAVDDMPLYAVHGTFAQALACRGG